MNSFLVLRYSYPAFDSLLPLPTPSAGAVEYTERISAEG